jgi:hypothetical protein
MRIRAYIKQKISKKIGLSHHILILGSLTLYSIILNVVQLDDSGRLQESESLVLMS